MGDEVEDAFERVLLAVSGGLSEGQRGCCTRYARDLTASVVMALI